MEKIVREIKRSTIKRRNCYEIYTFESSKYVVLWGLKSFFLLLFLNFCQVTCKSLNIQLFTLVPDVFGAVFNLNI